MGVLAQQGIDVPGQLSVVGFDDSEAAALSPVGLTSVAQQPFELARLAVERIVARIERRRVEGHEIVLEPELRVRSSTVDAASKLCLDIAIGGALCSSIQILERSSDVRHTVHDAPTVRARTSAYSKESR